MELTIALIRNGMTKTAKKGCYLGTLDEPLLEEEKARIQNKAAEGSYPATQLVYTSSMLRCRETARLVYPSIPAIVLKELSPMDLGAFTGRSYNQVILDKQLQGWFSSQEALPPGGGEDLHTFHARCMLAFQEIIKEMEHKQIATAAAFAHRDVIGNILQRYCVPRSYYKDWPTGYGEGYIFAYDVRTSTAKIKGKI